MNTAEYSIFIFVYSTAECTHSHIQTVSYINFMICSSNCLTDLGWRVLDSSNEMDHFQVIV